jgi:hypothetical protein
MRTKDKVIITAMLVPAQVLLKWRMRYWKPFIMHNIFIKQDKPRSQSCICGLLYALTLLIAGPVSAAESKQEMFTKVAAAYGAAPPAAMVETGTTNSFRRGEGALLRHYKAPDRFRIEISYPSGTEIRAMAGADAWMQGVAANPALRGAVALQAARMALPWNMLAMQSSALDLGALSSREGKTVRAFELALQDKLKLVVEIDPDTGYILRSRGIQTVGNNSMEFATAYSDFRRESGRTHAYREEHYAMGQHTGNSVITKVDYPQSIPDSVFMPR